VKRPPFEIFLRLGRVSNLPTVWTNVMAAAVLARVPVASMGVVAVALACSLFYVGGMFLNDAFDHEFDARVRPERPIPSGLVSAGVVFAVSTLAFTTRTVAMVNIALVLVWILIVFAIGRRHRAITAAENLASNAA